MILTVKEKKPIKCNIEAMKKRILNYKRLEDCYSKASDAKKEAYKDCIETLWELDEIKRLSPFHYGIESYNIFMFTFTGLFQKENKETGKIETYMYHSTPTKDEIYKLIEE